jgi:hypothetical protein
MPTKQEMFLESDLCSGALDERLFSSGPFHIPPREKQSLVLCEMTALLMEPKHASKVMGLLTKRAPLADYKHLKRVRKVTTEDEEEDEEGGQKKKKKNQKLQVLVCTRTPEEGGGWGRQTHGKGAEGAASSPSPSPSDQVMPEDLHGLLVDLGILSSSSPPGAGAGSMC